MIPLSSGFVRTLRGADLWRGDTGAADKCLRGGGGPRSRGYTPNVRPTGLPTRPGDRIPRCVVDYGARATAADQPAHRPQIRSGVCRISPRPTGSLSLCPKHGAAREVRRTRLALDRRVGASSCVQSGGKREMHARRRRVMYAVTEGPWAPCLADWRSAAVRTDVRFVSSTGACVSPLGRFSTCRFPPSPPSPHTLPSALTSSLSTSFSLLCGSPKPSFFLSAHPGCSAAPAPPSASRLPVPLTQGASPGRLPLPGRSLRRRAVAPVHASGSTASILSAPRPRSRSMVEGFKQLISSRPATLSFSSHRSFAAVASSRADAPPCRVPTAAPAALGPSSAVLSCGRPAASASLGLVASANTSPFSSGHSRSSPTGSRHASSLPSIAAARDLAVCRESTGSEDRYKAQLGAQLLEIDQRMLPDADQFLQKQYLLDTLGPLLRQHIGGQLVPFGSCANGFWVRGSDVDSCLVLSGCEGRIAQRAKLRVVRELVERHRIGQATVVPAQVPIAKVCNAHGKGLIDVSVNNCTALENSMFVETFGAIDDRVRPLGRFIKHWAKQRNINNRAEGTLSTYTLMLQLFFFLQRRSPPILPPYTAILLGRAPAKAAASAAPSSCFLAVSSPSSPSAGSHQADGNPASEEDFADCKRKEEDARQDVAAGGQSAMAPRTPAEGLKPLPFCTDIDYIRTNLFPEYGRNKETVGELIHDFFLFYGKRSSKLFSPRDGATVTVEVYDGSISVCPPPPGSSSSSSALGSPPPESSSCHSGPRDASSLAASAALSHVTAETLKAIALADPLGATPQSSTAVPSASSQGEAEESESKRQAGMCSVNESGEFASPLSMARRVLMRCPLTRAVVNRFSAAAWKIICDEFQRAEELVENGATLEEICAPAPVTHDQRKKLDRLRRRLTLRALAASRNLSLVPLQSVPSSLSLSSARAEGVADDEHRPHLSLPRRTESESHGFLEGLDDPMSPSSPLLASFTSASVSPSGSAHGASAATPYFSSSSPFSFRHQMNSRSPRVTPLSRPVQPSSSSPSASPSHALPSSEATYPYVLSQSPPSQHRSPRRRVSDEGNRRPLSLRFPHSSFCASPSHPGSLPPSSCVPPSSSLSQVCHSPTSRSSIRRRSEGPLSKQTKET